MDWKRLKFVLIGVGIVLSMGFLVLVGMERPGGFVYYLTVTEFMALDREAADGFRINGKVVDGTIVRVPTGQEVRFVMSDGTTTLAVEYHGVIPDTFVDGADVVVEGQLEADEVLHAHTMLAKCPSKYESAVDAEGYPVAETSSADSSD